MVKSKSSCLAKLPKEQRCQFLIGPVGSWFMPNTSDIWTQPKRNIKSNVSRDGDVMMDDCDRLACEENASLSYFIYGSIGCFCYGEIHHHQKSSRTDGYSQQQQQQYRPESLNTISATVNRLIDVKEDNSRVSCVRFLKTSLYPQAMILTESGSFLVHDCLSNENLVHYKKSELIAKFVEPVVSRQEETSNSEHCNKRPRFNVTQQINACVWPDAKNAFLGISLLKEKTNLLIWLKLKDITETPRSNSAEQTTTSTTKSDFVESHERLQLDLPQYSSPICCMEYTSPDSQSCLIAIAMDDGLITVVNLNYEHGQAKRVIKLARHNDQICSMSFYSGNSKKFPLGLLASASRNGLVLVWDVENEFYFADYLASSDGGGGGGGGGGGRGANSRINWFALSYLPTKSAKNVHLAVSNPENGLTMLELPENARSKIRLKESKQEKKYVAEQTLRHHALIFNVVFDCLTETIMTSSLDGSHILWSCNSQQPPRESLSKNGKKEGPSLEAKAQYLFPSMPNTSRTHMLRHSPIREDLLGIAMGKAGARFYKVAENTVNHRFDMSPSCGLIARKITKASLSPTSLSWHPSHEYRLAIGTLEGKVLRIDLTPRKATMIEAEHKPRAARSRFSDSNTCGNKPTISPDASGDPFDVEYQPIERNEEENTGDGDCAAADEPPEQFKTDGVYSLCWGPNPVCPQDVSRLAIYAIGSMSRRLFIYHSKKENGDKLTNYLDEFLDRSIPEAIGEASEVAWKSSLDLMALGTTTGKIIIASFLEESHADRSKNYLFKKVTTIEGPSLGTTYIQCLAWHPTTDEDDAHYYYIAATANESPAFVFNIKENILVADVKAKLRIEEAGGSGAQGTVFDTTTSVVSNYAYKLDAHKKAISDIAWSPHEPNVLATSSFDRLCYVWSIDDEDSAGTSLSSPGNEARVISKFSARDRLFTLEWSLVDTDLIFTSGHDSTIWAWRPSENRVKSDASSAST